MDPTTSPIAVVKLPRQLDLNAAAPLAQELSALRGREISLDASEVERVGAQCAQVLLSAQATWRVDGLGFGLAAASAEFDTTMALLGAAIEPNSSSPTELSQ
jgi:chemotaxis protein CheX